MSRYVVGIDLGTTNSALAYAELNSGEDSKVPTPIRALPIPQVVGVNDVGDRPVLPSFIYLPATKDFAAGAIDLPWSKGPERLVGTFARDHGAKVPGRLVGSAKSWLSHAGVDRKSPILPWGAADDMTKISPVEASTAYLSHLRDAWNQSIAGKVSADRLEKQDVLLTVPASFDAVARDLTVEAARAAGLENITLLEEPQAAFYAWLAAQGDQWRKKVKVGDLLLVCDVGGGTTDFTLIAVTDQDGDLALTRLAVGEHILLGGDNMDLALAHAVAATLPSGMDGLDPVQKVALGHACRSAKETLFVNPAKSSAPVAVLGRGSKVIGGAIKTELTRDTLNAVLLDGFFPPCEPTDSPARGRRIGLMEIGLPYATDPAITRHLARFLGRQAGSLHTGGSFVSPSAVLFNGGVFKADELRTRVVEVLSSWAGKPVPSLETADLDLSVALGATYYGLVRHGQGIRIRGGVPRAYYIGVETSSPAVPGVKPPIKALCVVKMGMEEGARADVPGPEFGLVVGEPAEFRFLGSTTRRDDSPGSILDRWSPEEIQELAPLETALVTESGLDDGDTVPVRLQAHVTEVGTLELWCQSTRDDRRWKLEYNVANLPTLDGSRMNLEDDLLTEARNPDSERLDSFSSLQIVELMNAEDRKVVGAVAAEKASIADAIDALTARFKMGGRLIYVGAGTSGRLGVLDASECPPTFSTPPQMVVGLIAGGPRALTRAVEGAEDDPEAGAAEIRSIEVGPNDLVVGIATSGRTPYVLGAVEEAKVRGAYTVGIACNRPSLLGRAVDLEIALLVGPEVLAGSTRLKAGTATKLVLNMLTTGAMVRIGKTHGNRMIDLQPTNEKLRIRTRRILREIAQLDDAKATDLLARCQGNLKRAIVVALAGVLPEEAASLLEQSEGQVRLAVARALA